MDSIEPTEQSTTITSSLSKKELKRQKKREFYEEQKKQKKLEKKQKTSNETSKDIDNVSEEQLKEPKDTNSDEVSPQDGVIIYSDKKQAKIDEYLRRCQINFSIIIDCDWESAHSDSTLNSLTQQVMFCYGISRRSDKPVFIHISRLTPKTKGNLHKVKFQNWAGVTSSEEDYIADDRYCIDRSIEGNENKKELVYLTADAEETITDFSPDCAYILGGIVDRNRLKGVTYQKAKLQNVRTAKLPIREHVSLASSQVLTINHVFQIIMTYNECKDWKHTLESVLPKRKDVNQTKKKGKQGTTAATTEDQDEENENESHSDTNEQSKEVEVE